MLPEMKEIESSQLSEHLAVYHYTIDVLVAYKPFYFMHHIIYHVPACPKKQLGDFNSFNRNDQNHTNRHSHPLAIALMPSKKNIQSTTQEVEKPLLPVEQADTIISHPPSIRNNWISRGVFSLLFVILFSLIFRQYHNTCTSATVHSMSSTSLHGWHERAVEHPSKSSFFPSPDTLKVGLIRSTPANPTGLAVALFTPDFAIDSSGRILQLASGDFEQLIDLATKSVADGVPKAGGFRNQWRIDDPRTSRPILWLKVKKSPQNIGEVSIYGYSDDNQSLAKAPQDAPQLTQVPSILQEAFGTFDEERRSQAPGDTNPELAITVADIIAELKV
jgi:hypothetical protein